MLARDLFNLSGEVALVTGASSGLGARFAEVLHNHGARVVIAARRTDKLMAVAERIGPGVKTLALDVADRAAIPAAFDAAEAAFGPVTLLVNNAGISIVEPVLESTDECYDNTMAINVDALWFLAREAARRMVKAGTGGAIINTASILSFRVTRNLGAYAISKAAVTQMTAVLANELARHNIRVNAIAPGYFKSEMTEDFLDSPRAESTLKAIPMRRAGEPHELDGALLLLASRKAGSFITGSTLVVDGGHLTAFI